MEVLKFIENRIAHFKEEREMLKPIKHTHEQRHYVQGKLNELQYLKKMIRKNKFPDRCPHCQGPLAVLCSKIILPNASNLPAKTTPVCWPHSQSEDGTKIDSYQKLTIQIKCSQCKKFFNASYRFESIEEVTDAADVWYDDSETIAKWRKNILNPKTLTRRGILKAVKSLFKRCFK